MMDEVSKLTRETVNEALNTALDNFIESKGSYQRSASGLVFDDSSIKAMMQLMMKLMEKNGQQPSTDPESLEKILNAVLTKADKTAEIDRQIASSGLSAKEREAFIRNAELQNLKAELELRQKLARERADTGNPESLEEYRKASQELKDFNEALAAAAEEDKKSRAATALRLKAIQSALNDIAEQTSRVINDLASYRGAVLTRLNGLGYDWEEMIDTVSESFGLSAIVKQEDLINSIKNIATQGIANNIELRAFLDAIKNDIAPTFNVLDDTLLRISRLQTADTSLARMGMQADLTSFLNQNYGESTYLNGTFKSVLDALVEAEAGMSAEAATEFEYVVLRWLGSMYSTGMSSGAISRIAGALGKLGSGDVSGLSGSTEQTLLAMAANRAGSDYADLLTKGLDASNVNKLLSAMVGYLKEMATDNNVLTSAIGGVFGLGYSDLKSLANLDTSIASGELGYGDLTGATIDMFNTIGQRKGFIGMKQTVYDNFKYGMGASLAGNAVLSSIYSAITDFLKSGILDFAFPTISVLGNFFGGEGVSISEMVKAGLGGISLISGAINAGLALFNGGALTGHNGWLTGGVEFESTGTGYISGTDGTSKRTIGNTAAEDLTKGALDSSRQNAEKTQGVLVKKAPERDTDDIYNRIEDFYNLLFVKKQAIYVNLNNSEHVADIMRNKIVGDDSDLSTLLANLNSENQSWLVSNESNGFLSNLKGALLVV